MGASGLDLGPIHGANGHPEMNDERPLDFHFHIRG